jgi:hypothetical protein
MNTTTKYVSIKGGKNDLRINLSRRFKMAKKLGNTFGKNQLTTKLTKIMPAG